MLSVFGAVAPFVSAAMERIPMPAALERIPMAPSQVVRFPFMSIGIITRLVMLDGMAVMTRVDLKEVLSNMLHHVVALVVCGCTVYQLFQ